MNPLLPGSPGSTGGPTPEPPFLSLRTAVVLLASLVIGLIVGTLTLFTGAPVAGAVLAALSAAGAAVPTLHILIGPSH
ncbi:hypothetical protein ACIRU8_42745 [Streptomyces sp. NPDC101175]|uniref:hypothetical protein n=1 Tax=Streptomyces sp. NPDC101175 TaxID=3366123 RepID=UPI003837D541